jgi:hypothetical protein
MISITLPSIHPRALIEALANIEMTSCESVEAVVVSPFRPRAPTYKTKIIWIDEQDHEGPNAAHEAALRKATGDFVLAWVDDHELMKGWDAELLSDFLGRENGTDGPFCLGARQESPAHVGTVFGNYYPYFPFMRRADAARGLWITGEYRVGFADVDLGMRVWSAGGRCEWSRNPLVRVLPDDDRKIGGADWTGEAHTREADTRLFLSRWAARYGVGYDVQNLRGFNVDVPVDMLKPDARSIYRGEELR